MPVLQSRTLQGGAGLSSQRWSAAVADELFVLQGVVSSAQRGLAAREAASALAVASADWLSTPRLWRQR